VFAQTMRDLGTPVLPRAFFERVAATFPDLVVFGVLVSLLRERLARAPGALFLAYLGLYSLGRLFTEGLRTDPLMLGSLRIAQLVSLLGMAVAVVGVPLLLRHRRRPA